MTTNTQQTPETMMRAALRLQRGLDLLSNPAYKFNRWDENSPSFFVHNKGKEDGCYIVHVDLWRCTCPDFKNYEEGCKHLYACEELLRQEAQCEGYDPNVETGRDEYILP